MALSTDKLISQKTYLAPSGGQLAFYIEDGYAHVIVPKKIKIFDWQAGGMIKKAKFLNITAD